MLDKAAKKRNENSIEVNFQFARTMLVPLGKSVRLISSESVNQKESEMLCVCVNVSVCVSNVSVKMLLCSTLFTKSTLGASAQQRISHSASSRHNTLCPLTHLTFLETQLFILQHHPKNGFNDFPTIFPSKTHLQRRERWHLFITLFHCRLLRVFLIL